MSAFRERFDALCRAKSKELGRKLEYAEVLDLGEQAHTAIVRQVRRTPKRNIIVDSIVEACGGNPDQTTPAAFRAAGVAVADIKSVDPDVTPDEIFKRAQRYRRKFPGIAITPTALCKYWGELGDGPVRRTAAETSRIQHTAPDGWLNWLEKNMPTDEDAAYNLLIAARNAHNFGYMPESWRLRCIAELSSTATTEIQSLVNDEQNPGNT